ncbi:MAG: AMP nucleosidase [Chlamydiales bacterium]|nr:AMP nucleosidase [Chlamydiales bacterium]MCH9635368.1 AMP nucleosidase [Chlamydiales bacterium]MCH9703176.1 AMP nucleosidase [Chlamydiota bacterium]
MGYFNEPDPHEAKIAADTLERYSGSDISQFGSYLLITNFHRYIRTFAEIHEVPLTEGSMFTAAHCPDLDISIVDFKLGSAAAALMADLAAFLPQVKAALMLGMCGGLRRHYKVGDYFLPLASIRAEGASDFYFPKEVPALSNFLMQKAVTDVLEEENDIYHIGITYTSNIRFWEFNEEFKKRLRETRAQAYEMECATLFAASYRRKLPLGALLLISDLPLSRDGIKTKESSKQVFQKYTADHLNKGIKSLQVMGKMLEKKMKGAYRGKSQDVDI